ncbi:uncharacterized protein BO72DRAFT_477043 [Aspergillus fijiensis CBS 313.89]|uniref:chitinase n=1 Tax=Aspergillus fijiensis CBS 313.89 TaxID=1448319 RepID=A0A8G1RRV0_9EURO|nr:uncharacterized protein BO72DRAFT_477043 [Aspergillus fijiensis CBS 313.89]RAK77744.1 hypothetical protein BO72DRAFT_477043 [Aspergillus fijiensis CBS 313.89]
MWRGIPLLFLFGVIPRVLGDTYCSADVPCEIGCCGKYNVCGMGPDYCGAECNPGSWPSEYVNATTCPLNEFCGNKTVTAPSCDAISHSITRVIACDGMAPFAFPQGVFSHIYFAFGSIDPDTFEVIPAEAGDDNSPTATTFSDLVAADSGQQNAFFSSLINFMSSFGFSGVDIDWEYPVAADRNGRPGDYNNYSKFLANLKKALQTYKYGLSITLPTSYWYLQHFDITSIEPSVDWFNFMSYDLHGTWDIGDQWTEIKTALDLLWRNNISPSKVNMGMAFYGRTFTLVDPSCSEPGCAYASAGDAGTCSNSAGILFGSEIMDIIQENDLTPTLYKDAAWASYDDEDTWKLKAEFAKSECLGGVLVCFSLGLAAALGNPPLVSEEVSPLLGSSNSQDQYCRFINCGEVCPSGFKEVPRADKSGQLMLDSTECRSWTGQTQTLCCPSTEEMPTCQWRGFHNSGKCKGGCCHSGYQSACCTVTSSTKPWSQCAWTESCESDETCPSGYNQFVSCGSKKHYNYCCSGAVPDAFTNCAWTGHVVEFTNTEYCTDACPSGSIRIAEESINVVFGAQDTAQTANCLYGNEAYCCAGTTHTLVPRYDNPLEDHTLTEFYAYLDRFLAHPVCPPDWDPEYDAGLGFIITRDTSSSNPKSITKNQALVLSNLLVLLQTWLTSSSPSQRFADVWKELTARYGYAEQAANVTLLTGAVNTVAAGNAFTGSADYEVRTLLAQTLCDIAESANGLESLSAASDALCEMPTGVSSSTSTLMRRAIDGVSMDSRSANGDLPTVMAIIKGILAGDLSFHYGRWLRSDPTNAGEPQVNLELAFWIGPTVGEAPSATLRAQYADSTHLVETDRWFIFHLHIVRDAETFYHGGSGQPHFYPGVTAMGVYQSQTLHQFSARNVDPRAEFFFTSNYAQGRFNTGQLRDYNARTQTLLCESQNRWYIGRDQEYAVASLRSEGRPAEYSAALNQFGLWLFDQGILSNGNFQLLWPNAYYGAPEGFTNDHAAHEPHSDLEDDYDAGGRDFLDEIIRQNDVLGLLRYYEQAKERGEDIFSRVQVSLYGYYPLPPFYSAAYHGSLDTLRALIDIYQSDATHSQQPLEKYLQRLDFRMLNLACGNADLKMTRFLLDHQPPLGAWRDRDAKGAAPLICAAQAFPGNVEALKRKMKETSPAMIREKLREHHARYGEFIEFCLAGGASVREADQYMFPYQLGWQAQPGDQQILGDTVLGNVVTHASYAMVSRLIAAGSDAHVVQTWYDPCAFGGAFRCAGVTPLHIASKYWNLDAMQALLDHGGRTGLAEMVLRRDDHGRPPLHWALMGDKNEIATLTPSEVTSRLLRTVKLLLDMGPAMVNVKDQANKTVLHYALLDLLIVHGADPSMCDESSRTMLYRLAMRDSSIRLIDAETLEKILTLVNINNSDVNGDTVLHYISRRLPQTHAVRILLSRGANVNAVNKMGNTPLHMAAGASVFPKWRPMNNSEHAGTPLEEGFKALEKMIDILQGAGASMDQANFAGETPREILKETRERWALKDFRPRWR